MRKARPPSRRQRPVLPLDVVDNDAAGPGQQRGNDKPNALAAPCRGKGHDMLRPVMAQILAAVAPKEHTSIAKQASTGDFPAFRPAGRAIGGDIALLPGAPERTSNGRGAAEKTAGTGQRSGLVEHLRDRKSTRPKSS